ncbi:MAG: hypothetical protein Q7U84_10085 [Polynucleobacter sp.]|nr:hypothetical protein [Polynucleobacter sp.]
MKKKPEAIPLSHLFTGDMQRLKLPLSLSTMDPKLKGAIEDEALGCAAESETRKLKQSATNTVNGSALKKPDITREALEIYREEFVYKHGHKRGWKEAAKHQFKLSVNTINARLK